MGTVFSIFRKPVSSSIDDLIEEGKRLHALYMECNTREEQQTIYAEWGIIKSWILSKVKKSPNEAVELWLSETDESFLNNINSVYKIHQHPLEEPLL
jgi:hypothetical protein